MPRTAAVKSRSCRIFAPYAATTPYFHDQRVPDAGHSQAQTEAKYRVKKLDVVKSQKRGDGERIVLIPRRKKEQRSVNVPHGQKEQPGEQKRPDQATDKYCHLR